MNQAMGGLLWLCTIAASLAVCEISFSPFFVGCGHGAFALRNSAQNGVVLGGWAGVGLHQHMRPRACELRAN